MPRRNNAKSTPPQDIVSLPEVDETQLRIRTEEHRTWAEFDNEIQGHRIDYDNSVSAAMAARDAVYNQAREQHQKATFEADKAFDEAVTSAWKTYWTSTQALRAARDKSLDSIRGSIIPAYQPHVNLGLQDLPTMPAAGQPTRTEVIATVHDYATGDIRVHTSEFAAITDEHDKMGPDTWPKLMGPPDSNTNDTAHTDSLASAAASPPDPTEEAPATEGAEGDR